MLNVSWGWLYTHSMWSVGRHRTHDGPPLCWSSFTGALILVLHGQCVTQVARGDIVIILDWCLCDLLLLKHIDEVDGLPSSFVTYWCWHIFCVENILEFQYWCLCDLLLLKHIDEVDGLPSSFVTYWCWHIFCVENILEFQYCFWLFTDVDYFSCAKCSYHSRLMFMWFSVTETYRWSACTSCWFVIYLCWHIFCVENILEFQYWFWLISDVDYFLCAKCSYHSRLMFMWFSVTETYRWSARTSCWFVIY